MKKNISLFLFLLSSIAHVCAAVPLYSVSQSHKNEMAVKVTKIIRKERIKLVAEVVAIGSLVIGTQSIILPDYLKRGINPTFGIDNPQGTIVRGFVNFVLGQAQAMSLNYFLGKLKYHCFGGIKSGRWNFTLKSFLENYTSVYEKIVHLQAEAKGLLYQDDEKVKDSLLKATQLKLETLAEQLCYVDGYSRNKIIEYEKNNKFAAHARLSKEYEVFEEVRNTFISKVQNCLIDLKQNLTAENFYDKVLEIINVIQHGSNDLHQRINSLNFYS